MRYVYYQADLKDLLKRFGPIKKGFIYYDDNKMFLKNSSIFLGYKKGSRYFWNINMFRLLFDANGSSKNTLKLDQKKAFLFVCGRDLLNVKGKRNMYFVVDGYNNFIGICQHSKNIYKNLLDIGIFLYEKDFVKALVV